MSNSPGAGEGTFHAEGKGKKVYDLEERLLAFASAVIDLTEKLPHSRAGVHVVGQMLRSGTSPYPSHGEAEAAESREDFIHKLKVCLKELRETQRWARLIHHQRWAPEDPTSLFVLSESAQRTRLFFASIQTAQNNALAQKRRSAGANCYPSTEAG